MYCNVKDTDTTIHTIQFDTKILSFPVPPGLIYSIQSTRKCLMSQGDSVIEEPWHTGLNALGTLGKIQDELSYPVHVDSQQSTESCCNQPSVGLGQARG